MNGPGYGAYLDPEEVTVALDRTRRLRLAVNVMWDGLEDETPGKPITDSLLAINDFLTKREEDALRRFGTAEHYLIIRPISLLNAPPPEVMEKISVAVRVLIEYGLLVGQGDAGSRDYGEIADEEAD